MCLKCLDYLDVQLYRFTESHELFFKNFNDFPEKFRANELTQDDNVFQSRIRLVKKPENSI